MPPENQSNLRMTRILQVGMVLTIEPGIYFIPVLLEQLRKTPAGAHVDWTRVEQLRTNGGIRIEDNITVTVDGSDNLTRAAFAHHN